MSHDAALELNRRSSLETSELLRQLLEQLSSPSLRQFQHLGNEVSARVATRSLTVRFAPSERDEAFASSAVQKRTPSRVSSCSTSRDAASRQAYIRRPSSIRARARRAAEIAGSHRSPVRECSRVRYCFERAGVRARAFQARPWLQGFQHRVRRGARRFIAALASEPARLSSCSAARAFGRANLGFCLDAMIASHSPSSRHRAASASSPIHRNPRRRSASMRPRCAR